MPKVKITNDDPIQYWIECPGCKHAHILDKRWSFNGDVEKPTFGPAAPGHAHSYLTWWPEGGVEKRCHSYITDGKIMFLSDCTHELRGQTVDLLDVNL